MVVYRFTCMNQSKTQIGSKFSKKNHENANLQINNSVAMVLLFLQTDHTDQTNAILQKNPRRLLSAQGLAQANYILEVNRLSFPPGNQ